MRRSDLMQKLQVYSRQGCHLCELLIEELLPMVRGRLELEIRDIDTRCDWLARYDRRVPVLEYRGALISEYPLDRDAVFKLLVSLP